MKIARMLGAFGLLLLFALISMGAGNSPRIGVGGVIGTGGVGPQSVPGSPLQQRGSVGAVTPVDPLAELPPMMFLFEADTYTGSGTGEVLALSNKMLPYGASLTAIVQGNETNKPTPGSDAYGDYFIHTGSVLQYTIVSFQTKDYLPDTLTIFAVWANAGDDPTRTTSINLLQPGSPNHYLRLGYHSGAYPNGWIEAVVTGLNPVSGTVMPTTSGTIKLASIIYDVGSTSLRLNGESIYSAVNAGLVGWSFNATATANLTWGDQSPYIPVTPFKVYAIAGMIGVDQENVRKVEAYLKEKYGTP